MQNEKHFDAFLSLNSEDLAAVEAIARWLEDEAHLKIWLYTWNMIPGEPLQESMEEALDRSISCVIFIGPNGIGPWQNEEMRTALEDRVAGKQLRVVPVILPQARRPQKESELPRFLRRLAWIDFRDVKDEEALHRLRCGILGIPPGRQPEKAAPAIVCPFRGLEVFREEDAPFFFGRDNVVQQLRDYLQHHRLLAVIGPSGSGKSSVVQAGLIPALKNRGARSEERKAQDHSSSPSALRPQPSALRPLLSALFTPQADPFEGLAFALRPLMKQPPSYSQLIRDLTDNEKELEYIARGICRDKGDAR
ncbi:MAG: toll/interleukin-1 receptor domain-containing protein, partial [bacterium]